MVHYNKDNAEVMATHSRSAHKAPQTSWSSTLNTLFIRMKFNATAWWREIIIIIIKWS